ncbi:MAG: ATP-binding protein [Gammaproteobacteria bacterium]
MHYIHRLLEDNIAEVLKVGKSILLLGPRQTGKTTLIKHIKADKYFTLANPRDRIRYEKEPFALTAEIEELATSFQRGSPLIIIDEIQKVPILMDAVQDLIDRKIAKFILTGSSARKLRRGENINLLPGRVIPLRLDPFIQKEFMPPKDPLQNLLLDGSLPEVILEKSASLREILLDAYVTIYLEEEIRAEALVRDLGHFARFLELAASESGKIVNFSKLSQEIGVTHTTIAGYYQILEDCLIAERIEPIVTSKTRRKLSKTQRYMLYDLGVRRIAAHEGRDLSRDQLGNLFEQYVGLELIRMIRLSQQRFFLKYWRDPSGPEVDWVIERHKEYIPIEVKWTETPTIQDAKYLQIFLDEYPQAKKGFIVCRTTHPMKISQNIICLPWDQLNRIFEN